MRKVLLFSVGLMAAIPVFGRESHADWVNYSQTVMSATIILLIVIVGAMALKWTFRNRYRPSGGKDSFWRYAWKNTLVRLGMFALAIVIAVNLLVPHPIKDEYVHDIAEFAKLRRMPTLAEEAYRILSEDYPAILDYHFEYLSAHYRREEWATKTGEADIDADFNAPVMAYSRMGMESNKHLRNIARLGLGMCEYYEYSVNIAMNQFRDIDDSRMAYKNLFMGRIHRKWGQLDSAEYHFRQEIAIGEVTDKAVVALAWLIKDEQPDSLAKLAALVEDPKLGEHVPLQIKRYLYTKKSRFGPYMAVIVADWWHNIQWIGLLGALLGTILWFHFLRKLDASRKEPWLPLIMTFTGGAIFSFFALVLYDFVHYELGFSTNGQPGHDFLYCFLGIGMIEELVKIIPFLLVMQFTRRIDNPLNYIVYASASALGFAFVENLMYFDPGHVGIMHGRILMCIVGHMFDTSTIAFGMMLGKYRYKNLQWVFFVPFFILAALFHGFYDFWLINEEVGPLLFLTYGIFIYSTFQYASYINNALNQTQVYKGRNILDPQKLAVFLMVGLMGILLFEYFGLGFVYGARLANYSLVKSLGMGSFLMFFVVLNLSNIDVVQGEWNWIRLWNFGTRINFNRALGQRLHLTAKTRDSILSPLLPAHGEVIARVSLNGDNRYFLFQFDQALSLQGFPLEYVLLKARKEGEIPEPKQGVEAMVVAFRDKDALIRKAKRKSDFKHLDNVVIA